ncbi:ferredoxin--NADP+ reductase [Desulfohalotomaculum tongense]|uniref:sulfide/dihydroorotate dehydrogenase-like FAD/NAD-binding protein n=1 Tax=Desulforadius tongensis TaxID=1216062 RepID=UPI00195D4016|nr:sulfide/dihydroorotate dehydrogenase-like FAD/NAD-binding protein [Desulforadius tongensis]MBM7855961.1 ferredoxin--NADP+ reductase [Desulforadius tongensis]
MYKIVRKEVFSPAIKLFEVEAPKIAAKARAGQFFILRVNEKGERIPLTIADFNREAGTITTIFQEVGRTTKDMGRLNVGDCLADVVGPLGEPTTVKNFGRVICVGGGVGVAPIYPIARALKEAGNEVISIIGARSKELLFWEDKMAAVSDRLIVCTDDGSYGQKGFVTDAVKQVAEECEINRVWAIGPMPMMRAMAETTRPLGIKTIVSLNPIMVDGTGMCGACRVSVGGETKFACVDGPEFDAHLVDFDLAMRRLAYYKDEEKRAEAAGSCGNGGACGCHK